MRKTLAYSAVLFAAALSVAAGASKSFAASETACGNAPQASWMSNDAAKAKLTALGYDVRRMAVEDGCLEAYAIDDQGRKVELYVHPVSGEVVRVKQKG